MAFTSYAIGVKTNYLRTTDIAYAVAVHPNTVRQYEAWHLLPPIPRGANGYRQFTEVHLDQMRLARTAFCFTWLGGEIRTTAYGMVGKAAQGDLGGALESAYHLLVLIRSEKAQAEAAAALLERWAQGAATDATTEALRIGQVADLLDATTDMLRSWERNGLIKIPRDPKNRYRMYGPEEIGRLRVIRVLRKSRYSTMAILRMMHQLDKGQRDDLRQALDTPHPDEDIGYATDQWLSTLARLEPRALDTIAQLEAMIQKKSEDESQRKRGKLGLRPTTKGGRQVVVNQFSDILATVLDRVTPTLDATAYRLYGTAAALLQGVFLPVRDINLLARRRADVDTFATAMAKFPTLLPPAFREEKVYTTNSLVRGFEVTMTHVTQETTSDAIEGNGPGPWKHFVSVPCGRHSVPTVALELRLITELARKRPRCYQPLIKFLHKHGCDLTLIRRGMKAHAIPKTVQDNILQKLDR